MRQAYRTHDDIALDRADRRNALDAVLVLAA